MHLSEIDKNLQSEFALKKTKAEGIAYQNFKKALSIPAFKKLDDLEKETSFSLGIELSKDTQNEKIISELNNTLKEIKNLKNVVLTKNNLNLNNLKPFYECSLCNDSGLFKGKFCKCFEKRRNEELIKQYGFDDKNLYSFDDINKDLFLNETYLAQYLKLKDNLEKWCELYPEIKKLNIILAGKTGVGKTFIIKCMAKKLIEKSYSVCFVTAFELNNMLLKYHTTFDNNKNENLIPLIESEFLFIDDLGTEPLINNVTVNYLYTVLSEREAHKKPTIITTNLSKEDMLFRYKERILSRLQNKQLSLYFEILGNDLRLKK